MTSPRPSISEAKRAAIFRDNGGVCHICERKIARGEPWHVEHPKARGLGGSDNPRDLRPAHVDCHAGKTRKDRQIMAAADRALKRDVGLAKPRRPFPKRIDPWGKNRREGHTLVRKDTP